MIAALIPTLIHAGGLEHEFVFVPLNKASSVSVAGTFNGWNAMTHPMKKDGQASTWRAKLRLRPGRHLYKFVVNGSEWLPDPKAPSEKDGDGNVNSILNFLPADFAQPAKAGDGRLAVSAIGHDQSEGDFNRYRGQALVKLTLRSGDAERVWLVVKGRRVPMTRLSADDLLEIRQAGLPSLNSPYHFVIEDGAKQVTLGAKGIGSDEPFFPRKDAVAAQPPKWAAGQVLYQVFADRFANGSKANDPEGVVAWNSQPHYYNWFGGDVAGVRSKTSYLKGLGIGALYFNPVFDGPSNHRYETTDYTKIDWRFGTNAEFSALTRELKKQGIRTILDGVFNHTSVDFHAFKSLRTEGEKSPFRDWFFVKSFPITGGRTPSYLAWYGYESMPKVNLDNPAARTSMLGVLDYWSKNAEISGWRLDVANEVSMDFWRAFRRRAKSLDPNLWIIGENWTNGSSWLKGDQWDSQMGYEFRQAAINWIAKGQWTAQQASSHLFSVYHSYRPQVSQNLMNLLGSHDTPRFLTECGGNQRLAALGATLLLTWPGSPSIYYGDELGMEGGADPMNRKGMQWELASPSNTILSHYKKLISLRNSTPALRTGDPEPLVLKSDSVMGFSRIEGSSRCLVFVNRSHQEQVIDVPLRRDWESWTRHRLRDALGSAKVARPGRGLLRLTLAPVSGAVILSN